MFRVYRRGSDWFCLEIREHCTRRWRGSCRSRSIQVEERKGCKEHGEEGNLGNSRLMNRISEVPKQLVWLSSSALSLECRGSISHHQFSPLFNHELFLGILDHFWQHTNMHLITPQFYLKTSECFFLFCPITTSPFLYFYLQQNSPKRCLYSLPPMFLFLWTHSSQAFTPTFLPELEINDLQTQIWQLIFRSHFIEPIIGNRHYGSWYFPWNTFFIWLAECHIC